MRAFTTRLITMFGSAPVVPQTRFIQYLDGTNYYEFQSTVSLVSTNVVSFKFATVSTGASQFLCDFVEFDASDLIQLTNCTATIDGAALADGADMSAYADGQLHELICTMNASQNLTVIGQSGSSSGYFRGWIEEVDINGTVYDFNSDNLYYTDAVDNPSTQWVSDISDLEVMENYATAYSLEGGNARITVTSGSQWITLRLRDLPTAEDIPDGRHFHYAWEARGYAQTSTTYPDVEGLPYTGFNVNKYGVGLFRSINLVDLTVDTVHGRTENTSGATISPDSSDAPIRLQFDPTNVTGDYVEFLSFECGLIADDALLMYNFTSDHITEYTWTDDKYGGGEAGWDDGTTFLEVAYA